MDSTASYFPSTLRAFPWLPWCAFFRKRQITLLFSRTPLVTGGSLVCGGKSILGLWDLAGNSGDAACHAQPPNHREERGGTPAAALLSSARHRRLDPGRAAYLGLRLPRPAAPPHLPPPHTHPPHTLPHPLSGTMGAPRTGRPGNFLQRHQNACTPHSCMHLHATASRARTGRTVE